MIPVRLGALITPDGGVVAALFLQCDAKIDLCLDMVGFFIDHLAQDFFRFLVAFGRDKPVSEVVLQLDILGTHLEGAFETDDGLARLPGGFVGGSEV